MSDGSSGCCTAVVQSRHAVPGLHKRAVAPQQLQEHRLLWQDKQLEGCHTRPYFQAALHTACIPGNNLWSILRAEGEGQAQAQSSEGFYLCCAVLAEGWPVIGVGLAAGHCPPTAQALQCACTVNAHTEHTALPTWYAGWRQYVFTGISFQQIAVMMHHQPGSQCG